MSSNAAIVSIDIFIYEFGADVLLPDAFTDTNLLTAERKVGVYMRDPFSPEFGIFISEYNARSLATKEVLNIYSRWHIFVHYQIR